MRATITGRTLTRDSALNLAGQLAPFAVAFAAMPATIHALGPERFGILGLAWTILGSAGLVDVALARAVTKFAAGALARGDRHAAAVAARSAARSQLALGVAAAIVLAILAPLVAGTILALDGPIERDARAVLLLVAIALPAVLATGCFRGLIEATGRFDVVNGQRVAYGSLTFAIPWAGVTLGWGLPAIAAALVVARFASALTHALSAARCLPELRAARAGRLFGDVVRFGGQITAASAIVAFHRLSDQFLLGALATLGAVGHFSIAAEIALRLSVVPTSVVGAAFPALSAARAAGDAGAARGATRRMTAMVAAIMAIPCAILVAGAHPILAWWLGAETAAAVAAPLQLLVAGAFLYALSSVAIASLQAAGRADLITRLRAWTLAPFFLIQWWAIARWGLDGAAWGALGRAAIETSAIIALARAHADGQRTSPGTASAAPD